MLIYLYMYSILGRGSFCFNYCLNSAWHGGDQFVALLRWYGSPGFFDSGLQLICIVGSGVSHLPLDNTRRFSMGFRSGEFAGQSSTVTPWSLNQLLVPLAVWAVPSPAGKWNQHLHKACQQKEAWSALKFPGRWLLWLWTSENTVDQHQQMTWQPKSSLTVKTSHWTSSNMESVPLHSSSRLWDLDFQMKCKIYFHLKRGLWTTEQQSVPFLHSPGKMLLTLSLVQKWLGSPFPEDVWAWWPLDALTPASVHSLWSSPKCLNQLCLTVFSSLRSSCCLCTFSYPNSSFQSTCI